MKNFLRGFATTAVTLVCLPSPCGSVTDNERKEARLLLEQAFDHGSTWRRGTVDITLEKYEPSRSTHRQFFAFDHDAHLMRLVSEMDRPGQPRWACKHLITPTEIVLSSGDPSYPNGVARYAPDDGPNIPDAKPIDLQTLAVANATHFVNRGVFDLAFLKERYDAWCRADRLISFRRDGSSVEATWEISSAEKMGSKDDSRRTFEFDLDTGGLPVRILLEMKNSETGQWESYGLTSIRWKRIGDTWVPSHWKSSVGFNPANPKDAVEITLDWKSVNEPLPEKLFTAEDLSLDPRSLVLNRMVGAPVLEGPVQDWLSPPNEAKGLEVAGRGRFWLIVVNSVLLIAIVVSLLLWRRRRVA